MNFRETINYEATRNFRNLKEEKIIPKYTKVSDHNPCPKCGSDAYSIVENGMYRVCCLECGEEKSIKLPLFYQEHRSERTIVLIEWNSQFLRSKLSENSMQKIGIKNGDYVLTDSLHGNILYIAANEDELSEYIIYSTADCCCDIYFDTYIVKEGKFVTKNQSR